MQEGEGAPPRGPRRDLWVVVVTTSESWKGLATTPAATRPLCAPHQAQDINL